MQANNDCESYKGDKIYIGIDMKKAKNGEYKKVINYLEKGWCSAPAESN